VLIFELRALEREPARSRRLVHVRHGCLDLPAI
jgi:hypothetical protein